jgi:eukaryotic-like serine/threonine-protein kinase
MRLPGISGRTSVPDERKSTRQESPAQRYLGQTFLHRYTTVHFLGEGSNSHVFLAQDGPVEGNSVVVKRIKDEIAATSTFRQFFDAEVKSMKRFSHPYAVHLLDASLDDPLGPCMVLDFIPGVTLEDLLHRTGRLSPERAGRLLAPLCHALHAAHSAGIVHRDLKPANLMVIHADTPNESIRVMDFGFASFATKPHIQLADLTGKGTVYACGTPAYVSPEMIRGDAIDSRADLYTVGVILYEMLSGRLPFECQTQEEVLAAHVHRSPLRFHRIGLREIPIEAETVVQLAMSKFPNERFATAKDLLDHYSKVVGYDLWAATAPADYEKPTSWDEEEIIECELAPDGEVITSPEDPYVLSDRFEAFLPERMAAAKLRGFIEDTGGKAIASEPGLIRVRFDLPSNWVDPSDRPKSNTAIFNWLSSSRIPHVATGREPIELDMQMLKLDPNRVAVLITLRPLKWYIPKDFKQWRERCESLYTVLRRYLMAD